MKAKAEHKEYNIEEFEEKVILPANNHKTIDFDFQKGEELEIIFKVQVKQELQIDIWFVNEDNYLLLSNGAQFLFFIDGSEQQISYSKRIVTLKEKDVYKLVMTNYQNNQTVEINIVGELRYPKEVTKESKSEFPSELLYLLIMIYIIFIIVFIFLSVKLRSYKKNEKKNSQKSLDKKGKANKSKQKKKKDEKFISKKSKENRSDQTKNKKSNKASLKKSKPKKTSPNANYCGYCGESVITPYCKKCGQEV